MTLDEFFNGKDKFIKEFHIDDFKNFIDCLPEEGYNEWTVIIEGVLINDETDPDHFDREINKLCPHNTMFILDRKEKIMNFMSCQLYELNEDQL